ncbi:MAG: DUF2064 domain-containing protein [Nitrospinae bacterium]|nr:DUF2064 domain-containing protein [Nitrospinota bacterium]
MKGMERIVRRLNLGARNERRFAFVPQTGESFTDRVSNAFAAEKGAGGEELLMIGADAPLIKPETVDAAFDFVYARSGMALGPTGEGGAYLIGFPADAPVRLDTAFDEGAELLNLTAEARRLALPLKLLPLTLDVDVEADLVSLVALLGGLEYQRSFETQTVPMNTLRVAGDLGLSIQRSGDESRAKKIVAAQPA